MRTQPSQYVNNQLPLAIQLNDDATLSNFRWGDNTILQQQLQNALAGNGDHFFYLWGNTGVGKTHLLQACCHASQDAMYCPLSLFKDADPGMLENLDHIPWICIDDVHLIANLPAWEEALFHLYNKVRDNAQSTLILSGNLAPIHLSIALPDLRSRLSWGLVFQVHDLHDDEKIAVLIDAAKTRGFTLPYNVARFLVNRCTRNMHDLHAILHQLDEASLATKRKITIPFVKTVVGV